MIPAPISVPKLPKYHNGTTCSLSRLSFFPFYLLHLLPDILDLLSAQILNRSPLIILESVDFSLFTPCRQGKTLPISIHIGPLLIEFDRFNSQASQRHRLFAGYDESRQQSQTPPSYGYPGPPPGTSTPPSGAFAAYPPNGNVGGFRSATPNSKGQYSDAVLSELESQNDEQMAGLSGKVKRLKDVCLPNKVQG
jgi:hypothetical protein